MQTATRAGLFRAHRGQLQPAGILTTEIRTLFFILGAEHRETTWSHPPRRLDTTPRAAHEDARGLVPCSTKPHSRALVPEMAVTSPHARCPSARPPPASHAADRSAVGRCGFGPRTSSERREWLGRGGATPYPPTPAAAEPPASHAKPFPTPQNPSCMVAARVGVLVWHLPTAALVMGMKLGPAPSPDLRYVSPPASDAANAIARPAIYPVPVPQIITHASPSHAPTKRTHDIYR